MKEYFVYIITNKKDGVLYIGRTEDAARRIYEHKNGFVNSFSKKYNLTKLVYLEKYNDALEAAQREKSMKAWKRAWKVQLIEGENPEWNDLYFQLNQ